MDEDFSLFEGLDVKKKEKKEVSFCPEPNYDESMVVEDIEDLEKLGNKKIFIPDFDRDADRNLPIFEIIGSEISLCDFDDLMKMADGRIITSASRAEKRGTLNDPGLGTIETGKLCSTCGNNKVSCPGHIGIIPFHEDHPRLNPHYIRDIISVLIAVCNSCGKLKVTKEILEREGVTDKYPDRLRQIEEISKKIHCSTEIPPEAENVDKCKQNIIFQVEKSMNHRPKQIIYKLTESDQDRVLAPKEVYEILSTISDEDAELLGFKTEFGMHPKHYILRGLPVMPKCARPDNFVNGVISPDQTTKQYETILKLLSKINELKPDNPDLAKNLENLDLAIASFLDNKNSDGMDYRGKGTAAFTSSIKSKIHGKEGYLRKSTMGKRCDSSGRTVVSVGPELKFGQIGIPRYMANKTILKEKVTSQNIDFLQELFDKGEINAIYSAKRGRKKYSKLIMGDKVRDVYRLKIGDKVDRWLQNGDMEMFGRNPTIHKYGLMAAEVVLHDDLVVRIPMSYTEPLNADFDGDEINLNTIQNTSGREELRTLLNVKKCIISTQTNKPVMGLHLDAVLGSYIMVEDNAIDPLNFNRYLDVITRPFDRDEFYHRLKRFNVPLDSGAALFSATLPREFNYEHKGVVIRNGILTKGSIKKEHIGTKHNSIIQAIYKDFGENEVTDFITDITFVTNAYNKDKGITVGIQDCLIDDEKTKRTKEEAIAKARLAVNAIGYDAIDPLEMERQEREVIAELDKAKNIGDKILQESFKDDNSIRLMFVSGSKGSANNAAQISGIIGQTFLKQGRPDNAIARGTRVLPMFEEGDTDVASRGFIANSFLSGMEPSEMFFHSLSSREGVLDTSKSTQKVGKMSRDVMKSVEDITVEPDMSVRNSERKIIEFQFGDDSLNPEYLENVESEIGIVPFYVNVFRLALRLNAKYDYFKENNSWIKK